MINLLAEMLIIIVYLIKVLFRIKKFLALEYVFAFLRLTFTDIQIKIKIAYF